MSPAANPFHKFGGPRPQKLKRGRVIKSIRQLAYVHYIDMMMLYEVRR